MLSKQPPKQIAESKVCSSAAAAAARAAACLSLCHDPVLTCEVAKSASAEIAAASCLSIKCDLAMALLREVAHAFA